MEECKVPEAIETRRFQASVKKEERFRYIFLSCYMRNPIGSTSRHILTEVGANRQQIPLQVQTHVRQ